MPTFTGKTFASFYKNLLGIDQASNTGRDATTRKVQDGLGQDTSISVSDDVLSVQPGNDNTTGTMIVKNAGGSNILAVDTTNSLVKVGASQVAATTQEKAFGIYELSPIAGTHQLMASQTGLPSVNATIDWISLNLGTGTNPVTTFPISVNVEHFIPSYWFISSNITIDEVRVLAGCDASSTLNFHLMSFSVVTGSGSTAGNLSSGVYNATTGTTDPDSLSPITVGDDRMAISTLTIENADVDSGKVMLACVENVGGTDDVTAQLIVKYHIR
tara:strand:- start:1373 stop:2188 length:816 start_codon:yes stop_codon:yes gene_type:complete